MASAFDSTSVAAAFAQPGHDGVFDAALADYLEDVCLRPSVVLAFAPKAAGTYLRSAAMVAAGGALVRTTYAHGGRDAQFYLPAFLAYHTAGQPARTMVTHVHMQALPANRHFITALGLKPVIMLRSIPDMLASYLDMLRDDPANPQNWLNIALPPEFAQWSDAARGDFIIDMMGPWYASYFATWLDFARSDSRVLVLDYDGFRADPAATLERLLAHSGVARTREQCEAALAAVWEDRISFRYNKGISGRGAARFTPAQWTRLERQLSWYPNLTLMIPRLIPPLSASSTARQSSKAA